MVFLAEVPQVSRWGVAIAHVGHASSVYPFAEGMTARYHEFRRFCPGSAPNVGHDRQSELVEASCAREGTQSRCMDRVVTKRLSYALIGTMDERMDRGARKNPTQRREHTLGPSPSHEPFVNESGAGRKIHRERVGRIGWNAVRRSTEGRSRDTEGYGRAQVQVHCLASVFAGLGQIRKRAGVPYGSGLRYAFRSGRYSTNVPRRSPSFGAIRKQFRPAVSDRSLMQHVARSFGQIRAVDREHAQEDS